MKARVGIVATTLAFVAGTAIAVSPPAAVPASLTQIRAVADGETLLDLARSNGLGFVEMIAANPGVDPWLPGKGRSVVLPTTHLPPDAPPRGLVVNLGDMRLYYFYHPDADPLSFPIGVGKAGWELAEGTTRVAGKRHRPAWHVPPSIRRENPRLPAVVPPGPNNPLGDYSLDLASAGIRIHGTNRPYGVGRRVSHGCIRLYPEEIAALYPMVPVGTPVTVVDQPAKLGWRHGHLWLEVHPGGRQADELEDRRPMTPLLIAGMADKVARAAGGRADEVDWDLVRRAVEERRGYPVRITLLVTKDGPGGPDDEN